MQDGKQLLIKTVLCENPVGYRDTHVGFEFDYCLFSQNLKVKFGSQNIQFSLIEVRLDFDKAICM